MQVCKRRNVRLLCLNIADRIDFLAFVFIQNKALVCG
jgi:hypothetical protein